MKQIRSFVSHIVTKKAVSATDLLNSLSSWLESRPNVVQRMRETDELSDAQILDALIYQSVHGCDLDQALSATLSPPEARRLGAKLQGLWNNVPLVELLVDANLCNPSQIAQLMDEFEAGYQTYLNDLASRPPLSEEGREILNTLFSEKRIEAAKQKFQDGRDTESCLKSLKAALGAFYVADAKLFLPELSGLFARLNSSPEAGALFGQFFDLLLSLRQMCLESAVKVDDLNRWLKDYWELDGRLKQSSFSSEMTGKKAA